MVKDVREALERAQGDPPPWRHGVDDFVEAGRRLERRRRARLVAGSSALAVLTAGGLLGGSSVLDRLSDGHRTPPAAALATGTSPGPGRASTGPAAGTGPVRTGPTGSDPAAAREWEAFFRAGYDYDDAVLLARFWGRAGRTDEAKARAGGKLLAGREVPVKPGETAQTVSRDVAIDAFFNNGLDYTDAEKLAKAWKVRTTGGNLGDVKATAGRHLLAGTPLPR